MITVLSRQNALDISMQKYGTVKSVLEFAFANDISLTDDIDPGFVLLTPESIYTDADVVSFFVRANVKPATAEPFKVADENKGIGYMTIESSLKPFKVI